MSTVKRYIPTPMWKSVPKYDNKFFITNIDPRATKNELENYLEAKAKVTPEEILFGEEEGTALVTFEESPDIEKLKTALMKKPLLNCHLQIHTVAVSDCVVVTGFSETLSSDTLEFYFDNEIRSGVTGVKDVNLIPSEGKCLIYFDDPQSALDACKRKHTVDGKKLTVQVYHEYLSQPAVDDDTPKFKPLKPITIEGVNFRKIEFLLNSEINQAAFQKKIGSLYAEVTWPEKPSDFLKIRCTLDEDVKDCRKLAKTWAKSVTAGAKKFLDMLAVEDVETLQDAWDDVMKNLREINIPNPDGVALRIVRDELKIVIFGYQSDVEDVKSKVKTIIQNVGEELERRKHYVTKDVPLKLFQIQILLCIHYLDQLRKEYNDLQIYPNVKALKIIFTGMSSQVSASIMKMYETLQNVVGVPAGKFSDGFIKFLTIPEVKTYIGKQMKMNRIIGVWDIQEGNIIKMYSLSYEGAVTAVKVLKDSVIEITIPLDAKQSAVLNHPRWSREIKRIEEDYSKAIVQINDEDPQNVVIYQTSAEDEGIVKQKVSDIFYKYATQKESYDRTPQSWKETASCTTPTGQVITTVVGDITELKVDVLVNAANKELKHVGGLAKAIVDKGGIGIQRECDEYVRKKSRLGKMYEGAIFCGSPGKLQCKMIAHAVGPVWRNGRHKEDEYLTQCIQATLEQMDDKKFHSVAIPALCTGVFGYPVQKATKTIVESIRDYLKENGRDTKITKIYLCDMKEDTVDHFVSALEKLFDKANVQRQKGRTTAKGSAHGPKQHRPTPVPVPMSSVPPSHNTVTLVKGPVAMQEVIGDINTDQNWCDLCYARHLTKTASYLCPECEEKMCSGCFEHHNLMKLTKHHEVIKIESFQKLPFSITNITYMCEEHDKRLDLYCQDHEQICCVLCIEKAHRSCRGLKPVADLVKHSKSSTKFESIEGSLKNSMKNLKAAISDRHNFQNILKQKQNIATKVKQHNTALMQRIKQLESSALEQLESVTQTLMSNDNGLLENLEKVKREADTFQDNVEAVKLFASDYQAYMALGSLQEEVSSIEKQIKSFHEQDLFKRPVIQINYMKSMVEESLLGDVTVSYQPPLVMFEEEPRAQIGLVSNRIHIP